MPRNTSAHPVPRNRRRTVSGAGLARSKVSCAPCPKELPAGRFGGSMFVGGWPPVRMPNEPLARRLLPEFFPAVHKFNDLSCRTSVADLTHDTDSSRRRGRRRAWRTSQSRSIFHSLEAHSARRATKQTTGEWVHCRSTESRRSFAEQTPDPEHS